MSMKGLMAAGNSLSLGDKPPEGVSFDGTNDYLSRSSDLTGNADGKTLTISAWIYNYKSTGTSNIYSNGNDTVRLYLSGKQIAFISKTSGYSNAVWIEADVMPYPMTSNTWQHILISYDATNSSNRYFYLNDQAVSVSWPIYNNVNADFTATSHRIASSSGGSNKLKGRLAHFFMDHTYRDLSTESNRRLFIDSDGKPASGQASLNPILYLPMKDASSAGTNEGTGGDFTVNGVLDTAQRGANQDNCSAASPSLSNNYQSLENTIAIPSGTTGFTMSASFRTVSNASGAKVRVIERAGQIRLLSESGNLYIRATDSAGALAMNIQFVVPYNRTMSVQVSFDTTSSSKYHIYIDGVNYTSAGYSYYNQTTNHNSNDLWISGRTTEFVVMEIMADNANEQSGWVGEVYFDTEYTDLATDNPFWDSETNKHIPVKQVIDDIGATPTFALPLNASDAGNNLGAGGDFTYTNAPNTPIGRRGGSEYWARSMTTGSVSTDRIQRASTLAGASNGKQFTFVCAYKPDAIGSGGSKYLLYLADGVTIDSYNFNQIAVSGYDSSGVRRLHIGATNNTNIRAGEWTYILMSFDMSDTTKRHYYYWDDSENDWVENLSVYMYTDSTLDFTNATTRIGQGSMSLGHVWFNTEYVDFSQESNRNKFFDQLRYPKDLASDGSTPTGNQPLIYMKFDDASDLGKNSGSGGDFTVNGTVNAGPDVDPNA